MQCLHRVQTWTILSRDQRANHGAITPPSLLKTTTWLLKEAEAMSINIEGSCLFSDKLHERQRDPDERVRQEVVSTICEAASENISSISDQVLEVATR